MAVVTGAASGVGRATAELLLDDGAKVLAVDRDLSGLDDLTAEAGEDRLIVCELDVTDREAVHDAIDDTHARLGPVDLLVNNAGISVPAPIGGESYEETWEQTIAVNLTAYAEMVRACLDDLRRRNEGRVVNVSSTEGLGATAYMSPYTVSKHGVIGLTRALAVELGPHGITVNAVCPGPIRTGMTAGIPEQDKETYARRRVALRRYGEPNEVAHVIWTLLLPGSSFVTGATWVVDGGLMARNA